VLLYKQKPKRIKPELKTTVRSSTKFDKARKLKRRLRAKAQNIERGRTKKEQRRILLSEHQRWFTGQKHQPPRLRNL
jgi:hypothetical protein